MSSDISASADGQAPVIQLDGVTKYYPIYDAPRDRLKQFVMPRIQRAFRLPAKSYAREFKALDGVSLEVFKGETVGIVGRNGSGKSTLLQMICGTLAPTGGQLATHGRIAALLELGAGFDPEFSGRENVYMNASVLGLAKDEIDARFADIQAFAEIGEFIDRPVKTYSSGMFVRLAFAVIAHVDADILVIDEALAVGDAFFVQKCMRFLRRFMQHGTVLFVSHDTSAVLSLCDRAIWLEHGRVALEGTPKEVADAYLKVFFEAGQGESEATEHTAESETSDEPYRDLTLSRDMRQDLINASDYRNDIEIFSFDHEAEGFGKGAALVQSVWLHDEAGRPLTWMVGGEEVTLGIHVRVQPGHELHRPIVGFYVKDRLGQALFGDNTFMSYQHAPVPGSSNELLVARFTFRMPIVPRGDYSISVAVADGTQHDHVQHHWLHDALFFKSHSSSQSHGLVGIPMHNIDLRTE